MEGEAREADDNVIQLVTRSIMKKPYLLNGDRTLMEQRFCLWVIWLRDQRCLEVFTHPIPSGPVPRVYRKDQRTFLGTKMGPRSEPSPGS